MSKDFYQTVKEAIYQSDILKKEALVQTLLNSSLDVEASGEVERFDTPSYAKICQIVETNKLPKRKKFDTSQGLGTLLHSIAHIEYSAIDLALDAVYRFRETPADFRRDWLEVASDEVRHFKMIVEILEEVGYSYGDFPVHDGLFKASQNSQNSLAERMAIIPRHYEATGLDVNPKIVQKLNSLPKKEPIIFKVMDALDIIYKEEIDHVRKGDRWFKWECERLGRDSQTLFFEILDKFNLLKRKLDINVDARLKAGFVCDELKRFGVKEC